MKTAHPQYWVHPKLQLQFTINIQLIFPSNILHNSQIYITINLPQLPIPYSILSLVLSHLSHNCNHSVNPQLPPLKDTQPFMPPILYHTQLRLQEKLPQTTQVFYYLQNYTRLYIFSDTARPIRCTPPHYFLHQSWRKHTHQFNPLINDSNPILISEKTLNLSPTPPSTPKKMTQVKYLFFSFRIIFLLTHAKKRPRLLLFDTYLHVYTRQKPLRYFPPNVHRKHSYYTKYSTHNTLHS